MKKATIKNMENWLEERWGISQISKRLEDELFYRGAVESVEHMGYWVIRYDDGRHVITKMTI